MKWKIYIITFVLIIGVAIAIPLPNFEYEWNPFGSFDTGNLQLLFSLNQTGFNITADNYFGNFRGNLTDASDGFAIWTNATGDITIRQEFSQDVLPRINDTGRFGTADFRWNNGSFQNLHTVVFGGYSDVKVVSNLNATNQNITANFYTGNCDFLVNCKSVAPWENITGPIIPTNGTQQRILPRFNHTGVLGEIGRMWASAQIVNITAIGNILTGNFQASTVEITQNLTLTNITNCEEFASTGTGLVFCTDDDFTTDTVDNQTLVLEGSESDHNFYATRVIDIHFNDSVNGFTPVMNISWNSSAGQHYNWINARVTGFTDVIDKFGHLETEFNLKIDSGSVISEQKLANTFDDPPKFRTVVHGDTSILLEVASSDETNLFGGMAYFELWLSAGSDDTIKYNVVVLI